MRHRRSTIGASPESRIDRKFLRGKDCTSRDLNPDPFRDWILSPARLPVPPLVRHFIYVAFKLQLFSFTELSV